MLKVAWGKLSAFVMANPWLVGITAAVAGLTALYMVVEHFTTTIEEAKEKTEEAYNELESITSEVESLTNKIDELNKQINSLDPITNAEDIENLETETALLEAQLAILKEKERLAKEEANKAAEESMSKTVASKYSSTGMDTSGMMIAGEYIQGTSAIPEYVTETEELNLAIDAYQEAQDKMKSLREEQVRLEKEFGKNSDEYLANANEISTLDEEMTSMETHMFSLADSIETQSRALDGSTDKSKELQAESKNVIGRYTDLITETNNYTDALNENTSAQQENANDTEILSTEQLKEKYESLNSVIDDIQSNYNTLASAVEEYNSQGYLSLDTLQSLINMDSAYLACLIDENGQLSINTASLDALIQAKLDEAEATAVAQAMTELDAIARGEATVATTDYITGNANLITSLGLLAGQYDNVAEAAMTAAQAQELSAQIANANKVDSEATKEVMDGLEAKLALIKSTRNKTSSSGIGSVAKSSSSTTDFKDILDKYLNLYEAELNAGIISFKDFLSKSRSMLDQYYREGKISAADYWGYVEDLYKQQLSIYDKVLSAVTRRLDKEIDGIKDIIEGIEKQNDALNKQKDEYDSILSVVEDVYNTKIESIQAEQEAIQDTIDKLQDENDEKQRQIDLEKARYQLYQSLNNRNVKLFNGQEFIYTTNRDEIRDAQQNLADLELEETISALEKEKEALDVEIEKLEEFKQKWQEVANVYETEVNKQLAIALWGKNYEEMILSNRISDIEDFKNNYVSIQKQIDNNQGLIDSYNEKITYYENLKSQWSSITDAYENAQEDMLASQVLGANWETQVLSGRMDTLNTFKNNYIATQQAMADAAVQSANTQIQAINAVAEAQRNNGGNTVTTTAIENSSAITTIEKPSDDAFWYDPTTKKSGSVATISKNNNNHIMMRYGTGTENAKQGIHQVSEKGDEIILDNHGNALLAKGKQLHYFEGGETVIKSSETIEFLKNQGNMIPVQTWFDNLDTLKFMKNMPQYTPNISMPNYDFAKLNRNTGTTPVVQHINLTLPNVTNESGYERLQKELHQMQLDALQLANKRY